MISIAVNKPKDLILGIIFLLTSIFVISVATGYDIGTTRQMGPGYLPVVMGICLGAIAIILIGRSFLGAREPYEPFSIRPTMYVLGAALLFAILIRPLGLLITIFLLVASAALADGRRELIPIVTLAAIISVGATLLFPLALGQQIPVMGYLLDR